MNIASNNSIQTMRRSGDQKVFSWFYASYYSRYVLFWYIFPRRAGRNSAVDDVCGKALVADETCHHGTPVAGTAGTRSITRSLLPIRPPWRVPEPTVNLCRHWITCCYGTELFNAYGSPHSLPKELQEYMLWVGINNWIHKEIVDKLEVSADYQLSDRQSSSVFSY